ncbi:MAG: bifunctional hydroxymethylpyrimidine kinase/phosphomethylpyrimidine kinase [Rhodobacteraceae bacterium]|nr:bifunctional hydroxymethylpyrimidine kinase/phosphomethylpyrimidine kinase [Paracoccaceae bacterium]
MIIAGSDSGGGAGIQADLKTASAFGVYGATALTAVTAQNTVGVQAVQLLDPPLVHEQIQSVISDIPVDAVKIGMLGNAAIITAVAQALSGYDGPVVLDPVMVAKSGDTLLADDAIAALIRHLLPRADLLTPNLPEAAALLATSPAQTSEQAQTQARQLLDLGARAVLLKGGHGQGPLCRDLLVEPQQTAIYEANRQETRNTHGTGCSYSAAIASELAKGHSLDAAVGRAHLWLQKAIARADALGVGAGQGPVHHFHEIWT